MAGVHHVVEVIVFMGCVEKSEHVIMSESGSGVDIARPSGEAIHEGLGCYCWVEARTVEAHGHIAPEDCAKFVEGFLER